METKLSDASPSVVVAGRYRVVDLVGRGSSSVVYAVDDAGVARALKLLAGKEGRISRLPFGGGWTDKRDFPAPAGRTFQQMWRERQDQRQDQRRENRG